MKNKIALSVVVLMLVLGLSIIYAEASESTVMTYAEFAASDLDTPITVETYVQAIQKWKDDYTSVYAESPDGAYFIYMLDCSKEDASRMVAGTPIRVSGYKSEWAGEIEIINASFEFIDKEPYIANPVDLTDYVGKEEIVNHQNKLVSFTEMTVEAQDDGSAFSYKNENDKTDDLYLRVSKQGNILDLVVEFDLCDQNTEVYKTVETLQIGDLIDLEGFLYWYKDPYPHVTKVSKSNTTHLSEDNPELASDFSLHSGVTFGMTIDEVIEAEYANGFLGKKENLTYAYYGYAGDYRKKEIQGLIINGSIAGIENSYIYYYFNDSKKLIEAIYVFGKPQSNNLVDDSLLSQYDIIEKQLGKKYSNDWTDVNSLFPTSLDALVSENSVIYKCSNHKIKQNGEASVYLSHWLTTYNDTDQAYDLDFLLSSTGKHYLSYRVIEDKTIEKQSEIEREKEEKEKEEKEELEKEKEQQLNDDI